MKRITITTLMLLVASTAFASDTVTLKEIIRVPLAVEFYEKDTFKNMIGRLELDHNETISVVTFVIDVLAPEHVLPFPTVYTLTLKTRRASKHYYIEGVNQYGFKISGTIDVSVETKPKIEFLLESGVKIVNIGNAGRNFQSKYIPNVDLGWQY